MTNEKQGNEVSLASSLSPVLSPAEVLRKLVRKWENFALRVQRHDDIRKAVHESAGGNCAVCEKPVHLHDMTAHHLTYEYLCVSDREENVPPCTGCRRFSECVSKLRSVHGTCHERIHGVDNETLSQLTEEDAMKRRQLRSLLLHPNSIERWTREQDLMLALMLSAGLGDAASQMISGRGHAGLLKRAKRLGFVVDPESLFKPEGWPKGKRS